MLHASTPRLIESRIIDFIRYGISSSGLYTSDFNEAILSVAICQK
jgi:hypothetical protein